VLLAIIGPDWVTTTRDGRRRLDDPDDWVRREIVTSLGLGRVVVTPVLVGGAPLPAADELPEDLRALPARQAVEVRPGERFDDDVEALIRGLGGWRRRWHGFALWVWSVGAVLVVAGLAVAFLLRSNEPPIVATEEVAAVGGVPVEIDLLDWVEDERPESLHVAPRTRSEQGGSIEDLGGGRVAYTGPLGHSGKDSFDFTVTDDRGESTNATANIEVVLGALDGAFNVAIARFTAEEADQPAALGLSDSLYERLAALEQSPDVDVVVAGPDLVGALAGDTAEARAESAAELAERVHADVVVMGTLDVGDGFSDLGTEFYLSGRGLTQASELAGVYALDSVELPTSDPIALNRAAADFLEPKVNALTQMAVGLSHYQLYEYAQAESRFLEAAVAWPGSGNDTNGQEVVFHLLGNVRGLQKDLDGAESYYTQALQLQPDYARSRFGLAEVLYQRSKGVECDGEGAQDPGGLEDAISQFEAVTGMVAPPQSFLAERSRVEMARILLCLGGSQRAEQARRILDDVISGVDEVPQLRELSAEAHVTLGSYHIVTGDAEAAAAEFETGVETTRDSGRELEFHRVLAYLYRCELDEPELALIHEQQSTGDSVPPLDPIACTAG
jgi:tetratricopeptide (TPR) repeat protein